MVLEMNGIIRDKGVTKGDKKLQIEVPINDLIGKTEELLDLTDTNVTIKIIPRYVRFTVPVNTTNNTPTVVYDVNEEGVWQEMKEEQTSLLGDEIESREYEIDFDVIDEFMSTANLDYPGDIDPKAILERLRDKESLEKIAEDLDMSAFELETELNKARFYYAPYASAWDEKRNREE